MKKYKFYCNNCGYTTSVNIDDLVDENCPLCSGIMILDENELDNMIADDIERDQLETMRDNIQRRGNDKTWYAIENNIDNPYFRLEMRQKFIKCGGKIPTKEIKI